MEEKLLQLIKEIKVRFENLSQILAYKEKTDIALKELHIVMDQYEELKMLYANDIKKFNQVELDLKYKECIEAEEILKNNYQKYEELISSEPLATKIYLEQFQRLLCYLLKAYKYFKELHDIENDYTYKGELIMVCDNFENKRFINPAKALRYYSLIIKIKEIGNEIKPLYNSLFYDAPSNREAETYPGVVIDDSMYFKDSNTLNPYLILEQYEKNVRELLDFNYYNEIITYNNMSFEVNKANKNNLLFNFEQISKVINEYGIDISSALNNYLSRRNLKNSEISFTKTYIISPEINFDPVQKEEKVEINQSEPDEIVPEKEMVLAEKITSIKELFKKTGKKTTVKYKGNSYKITASVSGKFLKYMSEINAMVLEEKMIIIPDFIEFLRSKATNPNPEIIFGKNIKLNTTENILEKQKINNIYKVENVRKPKSYKKIRNVLKTAATFVLTTLIVATTPSNSMGLRSNKKEETNIINNSKANIFDMPDDFETVETQELQFEIMENDDVFSFENTITIKDNSKIFSNINNANDNVGGISPYFDKTTERTIEAVAINYKNELIYITRNEELAEQKVKYYLLNGGKISSVLCKTSHDALEFEGFYRYDDINIKGFGKGAR